MGEEVGGGSISRINLKTSQVSPRSSDEERSPTHISERSIDLSGKYSNAKMKAIRQILLTDSPNSKAVLQQQKYKTQRNSPRQSTVQTAARKHQKTARQSKAEIIPDIYDVEERDRTYLGPRYKAINEST